MPQTNIYSSFKKLSTNAQTPANTDDQGTALIGQGNAVSFNITSPTVIKTGVGRVARVSVIVAGSTNGTINDVATTGGAAAANQLYTIVDTVGNYVVDMPVSTGLVVVPGTGMTVAVSYS